MRILLFKVSKEESIGEVLEAGSIIGHDVGLARKVESCMVIAVQALVATRSVA